MVDEDFSAIVRAKYVEQETTVRVACFCITLNTNRGADG